MVDVCAELERSPAVGEITALARIIRQSGSASHAVGTKMPIQALETEATPEPQR
ncbi:MAG: hypothetical protein HY895_11645 [Deltaproteobacteria bacterium]|nr:hypothetical protein [Deltaproteobacteria bacterium]